MLAVAAMVIPFVGVGSGRRCNAVAAHDRCELRWIRGARRGAAEDGGNLPEVVGAEDTGSDDGECGCVGITRVVELVDGTAGDAERLPRPQVVPRAVDRPGEDAREAVDRLV